ncbi:hypothetical protein A5746_13000 [Mycolicibacterium conceptionense]|uniref:Pr6Pr family membrane protein n=1 Tax=Mycolicibacterium conceptionense TaxID=451644 RepID=UPI0007ED3231|nr:Pr6Pr family membrane protein [Mycolicibacterium conceptionense]OBJ98306.1 hypothetical protein A5639_29450 [Mycolicibacterium conceptionense]OMB72703.1 hypothetical protein A5741_05665 [Mycolicibacterium conceptionense]OMB99995.1 hypothetical protein A5746_13000 [Mycolicibacterium conceptionense]
MTDDGHPRPSWVRVIAGLLLVNQVVGLVCQFVQRTDPRFPLWYFTVDSAVLAVGVSLATLLVPRARWLPALRHTVAVGVVVSAVIFIGVIAPATETGTWFQPHDDTAVRIATVLFHGTAPVLVIVDYLLHPMRMTFREAAMRAFVWPFTYLAGLCALVAVFGQRMIPYSFPSPEAMGWSTTVAAVIALMVLVAVCGLALEAAHRTVQKRCAQS